MTYEKKISAKVRYK